MAVRDEILGLKDQRLIAWVRHHEKLIAVIFGLVILVLVLLRIVVLPNVSANGLRDYTAVLQSFIDNLLVTVLVTGSVTVALRWFSPPGGTKPSEAFVQPFDIDDVLRRGAIDTAEWCYLGHTARYVRSQILQFISRDSLANGSVKRIKIVVINPENEKLCEFYAKFRIQSRSTSLERDIWSEDMVKSEILATVLCAIELQQNNQMLDVDVGFQDTISVFRIDICSTFSLVTQENAQQPAILYPSGSHFYASYRRELDLAWRQCKKLHIRNAKSQIMLGELSSIRECLAESGVDLSKFSDDLLLESGRRAAQKTSPYVNK